jgi:DNA-binding CsgD family transcriptional regulator
MELVQNLEDELYLRRARAHIVLLDENFRIANAQAGAIQLLSRLLRMPEEYLDRFPLPVEVAIQNLCRALEPGEESVIEPVPTLLIRVSKLKGSANTVVALQVEERSHRRELWNATARFGLTTREAEVLTLILSGKSGSEIADSLSVAETTVADYVKRLLRKTGSKNRAELLAKVFDWKPE